MIEIKHLSTTNLQNDMKRLTFEIEAKGYTDFKCELVIDLRWLFGSIHEISIGDFHLQKDDFKEIFYTDVPDKIAKKSSRFNWQLISFVTFNGIYSRLKGKGKIIKLSTSLQNQLQNYDFLT